MLAGVALFPEVYAMRFARFGRFVVNLDADPDRLERAITRTVAGRDAAELRRAVASLTLEQGPRIARDEEAPCSRSSSGSPRR
jgi:hypothetical protein